ncbi:MAG TPA: phenylalanine--tRNA ligase subunit beta, partial [candidate division WOR-3 bacterium]|nr:phenylalanine--tRNA ligase subunit beta [candidate division WOR-3 bacterium]
MKVLYNLLKQYIDFDLNPIELKETFENLGIEVEEFYYLAEGLEGKVTTGIVEEIKDHPSTRDYKIVRVYTGQRTLQVVSGAPNLRKGIKVVVALPGAVIKGVRIGEKNIKGVTSEANILSLEELGLEEESPGILILDDDFKVGESPLEKLGLIDWVYDLYIFPNRPDLMGVLGLAYELRAV